MTIKEQLIQEIEHIPDSIVAQLLDYLLFLKEQQTKEEITAEEQEMMIASQTAYDAGDYITLEEYEASQN